MHIKKLFLFFIIQCINCFGSQDDRKIIPKELRTYMFNNIVNVQDKKVKFNYLSQWVEQEGWTAERHTLANMSWGSDESCFVVITEQGGLLNGYRAHSISRLDLTSKSKLSELGDFTNFSDSSCCKSNLSFFKSLSCEKLADLPTEALVSVSDYEYCHDKKHGGFGDFNKLVGVLFDQKKEKLDSK